MNSLISKKYFPAAFYITLAVLIMGPLLTPGYILHYDMVFTPHVHLNLEAARDGTALVQSLPIAAALKLASLILPMDVVQKIILLLIFFLAGYAMYLAAPVRHMLPRLLAGFFYIANPFVYERFMAGHWLFLLAYSITPLVLIAFYRLLKNPSKKRLALAVLSWAVVATISPHHTIILGLIFTCLAAVFVRDKTRAAYGLAVPVGFLITSLWWIIPTILSPNITNSIDLSHFYAFATRHDSEYGLLLNILSLNGFWYEGWETAKNLVPLWPAAVVIWLLPVFIGLGALGSYPKEIKKLSIGLLASSVIALILAAGPAPLVADVNKWIFQNVFGFSGMRESQKFLSMVVLAYSILFALGLNAAIQKFNRKIWISLAVIGFSATSLFAWPLFWGAQGQLKTQHYPPSWEAFYRYLEFNNDDSRIIVFPWELYLEDTFADKLVANPARQYYGQRIIQSQNMNLPGVKDIEPPEHQAITKAVTQKNPEALKDAMRSLGAGHIMLVKSKGSEEFDWINQLDGSVITVNDGGLGVISLTKP